MTYVLLITVWLGVPEPIVSAWPISTERECREVARRMTETLGTFDDPFDVRCIAIVKTQNP